MPGPLRDILLRKARTLFPDDGQARCVVELLDEYGREPYELEPDRVRLAILNLSGNDPELLLRHVLAAKSDYRDVLAWAEYPAESRLDAGTAAGEVRRARAADAVRYRAWVAE